jgi:hypothetical protein
MQYYKQTQYPAIYIKTYWGGFTSRTQSVMGSTLEDIISNRNRFIEDFNIKNIYKRFVWIQAILDDEKKHCMLDHTEIYITKDKQYIIFITSPYEHITKQSFIDRGWTEIYPLYSVSGKTYCKVFSYRSRKPAIDFTMPI